MVKSRPVCIICNKEIEVVNPLELRDGFAHRVCYIKGTTKKWGRW